MNVKERLKERLLEIPMNYNAFREKCRLAKDIDAKPEEVEPLLKELCEKNILNRKIEYICPVCRSRTVMDDEMLKEELAEGENGFECDECSAIVNPEKSKSGYVYYNIKNKTGLINW